MGYNTVPIRKMERKLSELLVDEVTRTAAFTTYVRQYAAITGSQAYVDELLRLRAAGLALEDRAHVVNTIMRMVDTRNNDAADQFDQLRDALLAHDILAVKVALLGICRAFGDENLGLVVRFELEGTTEGTLGCMNDARGWALVYSLVDVLVDRSSYYKVEAAVGVVWSHLPRSLMETMTEATRITLLPEVGA